MTRGKYATKAKTTREARQIAYAAERKAWEAQAEVRKRDVLVDEVNRLRKRVAYLEGLVESQTSEKVKALTESVEDALDAAAAMRTNFLTLVEIQKKRTLDTLHILNKLESDSRYAWLVEEIIGALNGWDEKLPPEARAARHVKELTRNPRTRRSARDERRFREKAARRGHGDWAGAGHLGEDSA